MSSPLLHLLGAGPWQLATLRRARALGLRVLVSDGMASRPGFAEADEHALADISDAEATLAVSRRHGVDGILCDTTDTGVVTAAIVADALGLPGPGAEAARACCDKHAMGLRAASAGLPVAPSLLLQGRDPIPRVPSVPGPWVVKPVDNQSGRGVAVVGDPAGIPDAVQAARALSRSGRVLVQSRVAGTECIVDSLVVDGRVHLLGIASKRPYADNPTIASHITYGGVAADDEARLTDANRRLVAAIGLRQGLVHAEFLLGTSGPVPIDVAARGGGVLIYPTVLPHVSGVHAMDAAIDLALGRRPVPAPQTRRRGAQVRFLRAAVPGRIRAIRGVEPARAMPGIAAVRINQAVGDLTGSLRHKDDRLGFVVALGDDGADADRLAAAAAAVIEIETAPD